MKDIVEKISFIIEGRYAIAQGRVIDRIGDINPNSAQRNFFHIVKDKNGKWDVIFSLHYWPNLGGQQMKGNFRNRKAAEKFTDKISNGEKILFWDKTGEFPDNTWIRIL